MEAVHSIPLLRRADLADRGIDKHGLDRLLRSGALSRIRAGIYTETAAVADLRAEGWMVLRARALASTSTRPPVFSHQTAAALHGLPLLRPDATRVHVILDERRSGTVTQAVRHRGDLRPDEIEMRFGLCVTSLVRTMSDLARTCDFETAVCTLDAALRSVAVPHPGVYDAEAARQIKARALETSHRSAHGVARAARALGFADGRAQLPGESVSRVRIAEIGLRAPRLQVSVPAPSGSDYYLDFGFDDVGVWGEFDGRGKYTDQTLRSGRSAVDVLLAEKQREDWIRGVTGRPVIRWGWEHLADAVTLARRFTAFHVPVPGR
ncbi:type IV toxin-antitoxin system AbiEi family antitoxin domain-containing protein [Microbacterium testaceum]|uniref:type IV toxin-antitoxin system AbiEi family antitoxin domain-containing protein n=1 Tax=Microbacterium testaceum TaxID=2033 RepID=UPI0034363FD0